MRCPREHSRIFPSLEVPIVTQGEQHLMAEALLAAERGTKVPVEIVCRAVGTLNRLERMCGDAA